jgi:hypothetical protein
MGEAEVVLLAAHAGMALLRRAPSNIPILLNHFQYLIWIYGFRTRWVRGRGF